MRGLSSSAKEAISDIVEDMFDRMSFRLLGNIPRLKKKKVMAFSADPSLTLAHLFLRSMNNLKPIPKEEEVLKNMLSTAHDYIESLKHKTKASISESIDSYLKDTRNKGETPSSIEIKNRVREGLDSARSHFKTIVEAEGTKARNLGKAMTISRVGASLGQTDPTVFFVVVRDGKTCSECERLHLLPDRMTPRVWKLSELGSGYHKKGQENPKVAGLHPHCRCTLTFLSPNFGFENGSVRFIKEGHDEHKKQRG